jgi:ribosomal protein S18 acetylase RimI-like enzyme
MPIRPATPQDLDRVRQIVTAAYGPYIAEIGQTPGPMLEDYEHVLASGHAHILDAPMPVGLIVLIPEDDAMLLENVALDPAHQGKGHGSALMRFAEDSTRAHGLSRIRLYTHAGMVRNQQIYRAMGYEETHRVTEHGLPRVYMAKQLD